MRNAKHNKMRTDQQQVLNVGRSHCREMRELLKSLAFKENVTCLELGWGKSVHQRRTLESSEIFFILIVSREQSRIRPWKSIIDVFMKPDILKDHDTRFGSKIAAIRHQIQPETNRF
ncbi:unnamed protein product, partial [Mesorhabditis belari]|uniref:Uncharacterized protein n=1 Tax=Mesorhabditis belari TaxID=2138241 RepID=A0AAF3FQ58_9BILA